MGIWRVLKAEIFCDNCEKLLAKIEFDAADEPNIERVRVLCPECHAAKHTPSGEKEDI